MSKKIISVVLAVMLMISMISVAMVSVSAQVDADGRYVPGEGTETYRYYFYMPDDWTSEFTSEAGVYWWAGTDNCQALGEDTGAPWPGYGMHQGDVANVWYVDVPTDVTTIIFNNALDGTDPASESFDPALHEAATQTVDIACEYYDPGESENYPDGTENFDNMIWVPNSEPDTVDDYGQRKFGGEWYYYHGNGVYDFNKGETEDTTAATEATEATEETAATEATEVTEATEATEETTAAPTAAPAKSFTVTSTSNIADPVSKTYSEEDKTVTVTYYLKTAKKLLCGDWYLTYDPSILKVTKAKNVNEDGDVAIMPIIDARGGGVANLFYEANTVYGSFTSERLYDFTKGDLEDNVFVTVVFDIIGDYTQDTTVNLNVNIITAGVRVEDSETEAHVDQYDYIYNGDVKQLFKDEAQTLATLSEPAPLPTEPETTEPTEPETTEPTEPETTAPTEPETTAPTEPETTEPTEPETTEPTEPETTAPTEPETTEPTEPETTVPTEPETTEPTEPETTAPTEPETTVPAKSFTVAATSNYASTEYRVYKENVDKTVTVTYYLKADQIIGAGEAVLTYDPSILKVADTSKSVMPYVDLVAGSVTNFNYDVNQIYGSFTNVPAGYDFKSEQVLFTVTFDIVGDYTTDTVVDLTIMNLVAVTGTSAEDYDLVDYIIDGVPTDLFKTEGSGRVEFVGGEVPPVTEPETTVPTEPETTVPTEPETTVPTEPETTAPTEPETTAPTEPETTVPTEPETTAPTEPETTVPTEPETTAPVEPETTAPTEPDTTAPVEPDTTAPATTEPASVAPTTVPGATSTVSTPDTPNATSATGTTTGNGTVKTSDSPVAVMLLVLLAAATGFIIVVRKRELDK